MHRIGSLIGGSTKLLNWIGLILLLMMIVHVTLDVSLRFLFNMPLTGTITVVSLFYMIAVAFLPLAAVEERDAHISVEVLTELLPTRIQDWLQILAALITTLVMGLLAVRTAAEALAKFRIGAFVIEAGTRVPTWPAYVLLPLGFGLMTLVLIRKLLTGYRRR